MQDQQQMETTFFNILVRTSGRPNHFAACMSSIRKQTYRNYQVLVSYDDPETYGYVSIYSDIRIVAVEKTQSHPMPRAGAPASLGVFLPNLYFNTLLQYIREGFILFLDDDDGFLEADALQTLHSHISSPDDLLFWRVRFSSQSLRPSDAYFGRPPVFTQINTAGFSFHSKYADAARWDGWRGGDFYVADKLYGIIPNKIYIDRALTGQQDQHNLAGLGFRNDKAVTMEEMRAQYERMGYLPPVRILTAKEAQDFLQQAQAPPAALPLDWEKGYAAGSRLFYEMATRPAVMERVAALLGPDVILWGCSLIAKAPGSRHPWHCDIEASVPAEGRTLNVWIGLKNIAKDSGLSFIPFSHNFGKTVQQLRHENGVARDQANNELVLEWAKAVDPAIHILNPHMCDGEALFFDGRLWHASFNRTQETRYALLIQYATPEAAIRVLDNNNLEWPFRQLSHPKPPVILLQGHEREGVNRIVQAPVAQQAVGHYHMTDNRIYPLQVPLPLPADQKWKPFHIFNGATAGLQHLTCHVSALSPGHRPHPPHTHKEEEILMILHGEADVILPELAENGTGCKRLRRGDFVYYPAHFQHTLEAVGNEAVNYLMFKWYNASPAPLRQLAYGQYHALAEQQPENGRPIHYGLLFEGPTSSLKKLHCHTSVLQPGACYAPHRDPYDVAIVVLDGQVETLDQIVTPHHVIFYPAGTLHGMANPTDRIARYLVFEFHGQQAPEDRQIKPAFSIGPAEIELPQPKPQTDQRYEQLLEQYRSLEASYSLKLGRTITKATEKYLGWLPYIRQKMDRAAKKQ